MIAFLRFFLIAAVLAFLQAFIIQQVDMGVWLRPMPYLLLFFITPININKYGILVGGFFFGLFIDILAGNFGIHAASIVVVLYAKNFIDQRFIDFDSLKLQGETYVTVHTKGWAFFSYYALSIIAIHHLTFFMLDYFEFVSFLRMLLSTVVSAIGSFLLILLFKSIIKS
jgi:rod shape-determining protein MreD